MSDLKTPTVADFTASDALLHNPNTRSWMRFVPIESGKYLAVFMGEGSISSQVWKYTTTINKEYARSLWDAAVGRGYVKME